MKKPRLRLIKGGGKAGAFRKRFERNSAMDDQSEHLFMVLPAPDRATIAERLSKRLKRKVTISAVDRLLMYVRANGEALEWMPFYATKGRNTEQEDRYLVVLFKRDGTFHTDADRDSCDDSSVSTLKALSTTASQFQAMLLALATRTLGRARPKMLRNIAAEMEYVARKVGEALEEFEDTHASPGIS